MSARSNWGPSKFREGDQKVRECNDLIHGGRGSDDDDDDGDGDGDYDMDGDGVVNV